MLSITHCHELGELATFKPNSGLSVYRWFYFKEGFARDLVFSLIDRFRPERVLDPFCGSGTTLLACKERGIYSEGIDASPLAVFVTRVKTEDYDIGEIKKEDERMMRLRPTEMKERKFSDPIIKRAFPPRVMREILFYKSRIESMEDEKTRNFFLFALMAAGMKSSFAFKDGAVLKLEKRPLPPLRQSFKRQAYKMISDLEFFSAKGACKSNVGDARMLPYDSEFDAVITSPPYLNKIEYTNIYRIELELFLEASSEPQLRSYLGTHGKTYEKFSSLPVTGQSYFADMDMVMKGVSASLKDGGKAAVVIGNACYPDEGIVINSDEMISELALSHGLRTKEIICVNERWCTRNRTEKVNQVRESIVIMDKS